MLTATCQTTANEARATAQIEKLPSDVEISRRVMEIRSHWTVSERIRRRREAERRFADLMDKLTGCEAA